MKNMILKKTLVLLLFCLPAFIYKNSASPLVYEEGYGAKEIHGSKQCRVTKKNIYIEMVKEGDRYIAKHKIKYFIYSKTNKTIPLILFGYVSDDEKCVSLNNRNVQIVQFDTNFSSRFSEYKISEFYENSNSEEKLKIFFSKTDSVEVDKKSVFYFDAKLNKGENTISVEYKEGMHIDRDGDEGFVKNYNLTYSIYPSKYWESFGPINIDLSLGDNLEIESSNIGNPKIENDTAYWVINKINNDYISMGFRTKQNIITKILMFIDPIGISYILLIAMFIYHRKMLIQRHKNKETGFNEILFLGIILVPVLHYLIYLISFSIIDSNFGKNESKLGYTQIFYLLTFPFLLFIYAVFMLIINYRLKLKYRKIANNNEQ